MIEIFNNKSFKTAEKPGVITCSDYTEQYLSGIYDIVDVNAIRKRRFKVVVDVCQGVGAFLSKRFLEGMGCEVFEMNQGPAGVFAHPPEPLPENIAELSKKIVLENADIGFAQDPDGDRLAMVDEKGYIPGEEITVVIALKNILERNKGPVAVNLSTTSLVDYVAESFGVDVYRSRIGEVNVVEKMKETCAVIGGEGNGGVIYPEFHYGRDSFVGMALILEYLARTGKKLSEVIDELPEFVMLKKKIHIASEKTPVLFEKLREMCSAAKETINLEDGIKIIREDGWIHIRSSGTEPVLRIFAEGKNKVIAERYLSEFTNLILKDNA